MWLTKNRIVLKVTNKATAAENFEAFLVSYRPLARRAAATLALS